MALHKYTQEEFDALPVNDKGGKICPTGDYTEIKVFPAWSKFGNYAKFGDRAQFGYWAQFGYRAQFGDWAQFGNDAKFGDRAQFGDDAKFGDRAQFGNDAKFGDRAQFGEDASFEDGRVRNGQFVTVGNIGSENRTAYFYRDGGGEFFVRAGCWFSGMDEFRQRVKDVHGGTVHEKTYLAACDYAVTALDAMAEEGKER